MPSTRLQRRARGSPLGWIDLDPHRTNLPPQVDDHQPAVEEVPPAVAGEPQEHNRLPAQQEESLVPRPNTVQEPENETRPTTRLFGDSPLSSAPPTPTPERNMPPDRSSSRQPRGRSRSITALADRIDRTHQHEQQDSSILPQQRHEHAPSAHDEQPITGSSRNTLEQRISAPNLIHRIQSAPRMDARHSSSAKRPEEYCVKDFDSSSKLKPDGSNYYLWKDLQEQILYGNCWYDHVDGTAVQPNREDDPNAYRLWHQINNLAKAQLSFNMDSGLYQNLRPGIKCAADLWKKLDVRFGTTNTMTQNKTIRELRNKRIAPSETVQQHNFELRKLRAEVLDSGISISDAEWASIVVASFGGSKWELIANMVSFFADGEMIMKSLELQDATNPTSPNLIANESALSVNPTAIVPQSSCSNLSTFASNSRARRNAARTVCTNCGRGYHTVQNCWAPGGGATDKRPPYYKVPADMLHKERAHLATLKKELEQKAVSLGSTNEAAQSAQLQPPRQFMMAVSEQAVDPTSWLVDSGATSHFTNDRSLFIDYESFTMEVALPNMTGMEVAGRGTIRMGFMHHGRTTFLTLRHVIHVPAIAYNLLSTVKLLRDGIETFFTKPLLCTLSMDGRVIATGTPIGEQWLIDAVTPQKANSLSTPTEARQDLSIWHQRFAHFSLDRIKEIYSKHMVDGLLIQNVDQPYHCEACVLSKMTATPSPSRELRAQAPGDILHADLEFMAAKSFSGADISLKFTDEFSNFVWTFALKSKESAIILDIWRRLCAEFTTQYGTSIRALHTDNGTEFVNTQMNDYNAEHGIYHHLTVPYRHEMNGRAERMNRTGSDAVRAMLSHAQLPQPYWAEAYATFAYVHNRIGKSKGHDSTPFQILHGRKPNVSHLRTFGAIAYMRVPPEKRRKLDPKAIKCILLGYRDDAAYRLMDPQTREIFYSRDVIFDELHRFKSSRDPSLSNEIYLDDDTDDKPFPPDVSQPLPKALRRSSRPRKPTKRSLASAEQERTLRYLDTLPGLDEHVNAATLTRYVADIAIPRTLQEALLSPQANEWIKAMKYEDNKLTEMNCWQVVERPTDAHIIKGIWVYNLKETADSSLEYRARWVARDDTQIPGLEFGETFAASGDFVTAKIIIALSAAIHTTLVTVDITSAYLNSPLDENILVEYPTGFQVPGFTSPVCRLNKALYGLRQGARAWSDHFSIKLNDINFRKCISAPSVYIRADDEGETLMATHVDDCNAKCTSFVRDPMAEALRFKDGIRRFFEFKEKDNTTESIVLGMNIRRDPDSKTVKITVRQKIERALLKYGLRDSFVSKTPMATGALTIFDRDQGERYENPPWPYAQLVGELLWMGTILRVDIAFAANVLARYMHKPGNVHWIAALRVLRYLKGTLDLGLVYRFDGSEVPIAYSDSDWGGDLSDRKSTTGFVFMLKGGPVSWKSRKQSVVAKSTAEAEYLALSSCAQEAIWFRNFFSEINRPSEQAFTIFTDNKPALQITENPVYLSKTKHIDIPVHHVRDEVQKGRIEITHIPGSDNPADILTKPLGRELHYRCIDLLGMS